MIYFRLALRNILGAGLRTWLSVVALSFSFFVIVWMQGLYSGMNDQMKNLMIDFEIGGGQFWSDAYDPYDPLTLSDAHKALSPELKKRIATGEAAPVLVASAAIFPEGRIQSALLKGIPPGQTVIRFPSDRLGAAGAVASADSTKRPIQGMIGTRMARATKLKVGDTVMARFRDSRNVFDAVEIRIVHIFKTQVPSMDAGQIWLPLKSLRSMLSLTDQATYVILDKKRGGKKGNGLSTHGHWIWKDKAYLLRDIDKMVKQKRIGGGIFYSLFLLMALLAIFDTQVLSVFRRKKEIGTLMALGMTRSSVVWLFTLEGIMHGVLAWVLAALYGTPILYISTVKGFPMPDSVDEFGMAIGEALYPAYSIGLVGLTAMILSFTVVLVSYLPTRRISRMQPTEALRGNF